MHTTEHGAAPMTLDAAQISTADHVTAFWAGMGADDRVRAKFHGIVVLGRENIVPDREDRRRMSADDIAHALTAAGFGES
jgi:hypothetical protein